ncbi:MAG: ABC transporter permease subunit [Acidimicrobiaceae bacterium]|nr:ABC transporter permease subunit [Acidimicrobiaceae bacterium]MBO0845870.1 ABC transporter permease subunit [Nocardioides sp.]
MTIVEPPPTLPAPDDKEAGSLVAGPKPRRLGVKLLIIAVVWGVGYLLFKGQDTLARPFVQLNSLDTWINHVRDNIIAAGQTNWFFHGVIGNVSSFGNSSFGKFQDYLSRPSGGRPVPQIGWLGVVAIFGWVALALAGLRSAVMVVVGTMLFGILGYWQDSVDTVTMTLLAVFASIIVGVPVGIAMARRRWVSQVITPVLDVMQTMPSLAYIPFFFVIFGPGVTCAIMLTIVYSIPPLVRITEHGLRSVSPTTVEAAGSMGLTRGQLLRKVQLPMARRTIIVGVNQCTLAALSMTVIAVFVDGPGLGQDVLSGLTNLNVGQAAVPGLLIVVIAIVLDRTTTAASERRERTQGRLVSVSSPGVMLTTVVLERLPRWASEETRTRRLPSRLLRRVILGVTLIGVLVCIYLSHNYLGLAQFPSSLNVGPHVVDAINSFTNWVVDHVGTYTEDFKNLVTYGFLNPLQELLANTPWWLMAPVLMAISFVVGGVKPFVTTTVCSAIILLVGLWNDAMITLTSTLVATVLVMLLAIVLGVWIARSRGADTVIRPILDAFQTFPSFVYLIPALALFGSTRFTAIVAAVLYAFPISVKLVADGIRGVSATTVEAAQSSGITRWQMIRKVQLPMSRSAIALAANQGLLYVLSMVVIGGMVGAGGLGYIVISGFSQDNLFGKGLAAGITLAALGIMLDRTARAAADRGRS